MILDERYENAEVSRLHLADGGAVDVEGRPEAVFDALQVAEEMGIGAPLLTDHGTVIVIDPIDVERVR